ncbi:MAG: hypothetical protein ACOYLB_05045 [Phototrophicaceae bacterium]
MDSQKVLQNLRASLLAIASMAFIVTPVELWLTGHYENAFQWIPFILCGIGLVAIGTVYFHPARWSVWGLRLVMGAVGVGGVYGIVLHLLNNFAFELEIRPNATSSEVILEALRGANPLLAPGILVFGAMLALLFTYAHPVFIPTLTRSATGD